jgi:hypothetical protein
MFFRRVERLHSGWGWVVLYVNNVGWDGLRLANAPAMR